MDSMPPPGSVVGAHRSAGVRGLPTLDRTLVMGVVNVTPDSFSDGGEWFDPADAVRHGMTALAHGVDVIDVGGESTRPGAVRPDVDEELRRVLPVISALASAGAVVSVDTMRSPVAVAAVDAGARLINDVSGGQADPEMFDVVAELGVPYVCMHWRGHSADMQSRASYRDVVTEVIHELQAQVAAALSAGIGADSLIIDPGFGFAKTAEHNWQLLQRLDELEVLGLPLLVGLSRKAFLGALLSDADGKVRPARERDDASTALTTLCAARGVWGVRAHAVRATRDAVTVVQRLRRDGPPPR
jgi:dihydropteroate synthase